MDSKLENCRVAHRYPLKNRLKAKVLYIQGLSFKEIEKETKIPRSTVCDLVKAMEWQSLRGTEAGKEIAEKYLAEAQNQVKEWVEVLGVEAQELALIGTGLARDAADKGSARDYANAARGAHTFAQLARQSAGLDSKAPESGDRLSLNFFVAKVGDLVREKNVTPEAIQIESGVTDLGF